MAEDRMLSDEILLGLINKNSGGGGGGTDDYNDLKNQPQINGNTLIGDKSASDLGLASEDGLAGKQDASDNALQTTDKTIVGGINELKSGLTSLLNAFSSLGLSVVNGKVCQTYKTN